MSGPFIYIATNRLKPGKLADERKRVPGLVDFVEANESRLIAFNEYANEDGTEVAVVQIHPDADSMTFHIGVIAERAAAAYAETVEATTSIQVFGMPSDGVLGMLERQAGGGVPLSSESSPASAARGVLMEGLQGQPGRPRRLHEAAHSATPHGSAG